MKPSASIRFRAGIGGEPVLADMQASPDFAFEPARWGATIIASPGHPVAGDHLSLKVDVGVGCCAEIRSPAVTVARRDGRGGRRAPVGLGGSGGLGGGLNSGGGLGGGVGGGLGGSGGRRPGWSGPVGSTLSLGVSVARDAMLSWRPQPGVAADGCSHRVEANVVLSANARLLWCDEFVIDRRSEAQPGTWSSRLRIVRDGWPVVCSELALGPGSPLWESPAVLEGARAVSLLMVVDPEVESGTWASARATDGSATAVALPLAGPGVQMVAWGDALDDCRAALARVIDGAGTPAWALARWRQPGVLDTVA